MDIRNLKLYRRRFIPDELTYLADDEILRFDDEMLVTRWKSLHPRGDFDGGISVFFLKDGWKISKLLDRDGNVLHWYCDIIDIVRNEEENSLTYEDLLFDVVVSPSGKVKVLDCDEAAQAFEQGLITKEQLIHALKAMHELLEVIYHSRFDRLQAIVESYSNKPAPEEN
jgi:protein associated with RNAse G/E